MKKLIIPFRNIRPGISLRCNYDCAYCGLKQYQPELYKGHEYTKDEVGPDVWINNINRCVPGPRNKLTAIYGSGEPGMYEGFAEIINNTSMVASIYSNCSTLPMKEYKKIKPRDTIVFYCSFHVGQVNLDEFIENALWLKAHFRVQNFHAPSYPPYKERIIEAARYADSKGVKIITKHPYLGWYQGKYHWYGKIGEQKWCKDRFINRINGSPKRKVWCKVSFNHIKNTMGYPIAPNGDIYQCWRFYLNHDPSGVIGNFFDEGFEFTHGSFECEHYGDCNMCAWHRNIKDPVTNEYLDKDFEVWNEKDYT